MTNISKYALFILLAFFPATAFAQWESVTLGVPPGYVPFGDTGTKAIPENSFVNVTTCNLGPCGTSSITLNNFANATAMHSQLSRAFELAAISSALQDAIPNPGDRFAVRLNMAAFRGNAAGAIGLGWNLSDDTRLMVNYGQGQSRSIISGGVNFSIH